MNNLEQLINEGKEIIVEQGERAIKDVITQAYNQGKEDDINIIKTLIHTFKKVNDPKDIIVQIELLETVLSLIKKD